jgi:PAS domain-containing protein
VLKTTAALARQMLSSQGALVFLIKDGKPVLKAALGTLPFSDMSQVKLPSGREWTRTLFSGGRTLARRDKLDWLPLDPESSGKSHCVAAVPLFTGGDVAGYLVCFSPASRTFRQQHLEVLSTIASQAAVAVEKARLYSRTLDDKTKVETILGALRDGLVLTDAGGMLVDANPVAERMLSLDGGPRRRDLAGVLSAVATDNNLGHLGLGEAVSAVLEGHRPSSVRSRLQARLP